LKAKVRKIAIINEKELESKPEITLISVYDNYQVNPELKTA
jgi:hypothetical protein